MKKLFTLLALVLLSCMGAWADVLPAGDYTIKVYSTGKYLKPTSDFATSGASKIEFSNEPAIWKVTVGTDHATANCFGQDGTNRCINSWNWSRTAAPLGSWGDGNGGASNKGDNEWVVNLQEDNIYTIEHQDSSKPCYFWYNSEANYLYYTSELEGDANKFIIERVDNGSIDVTYTFTIGEQTIGSVVRTETLGATPTISDIIPTYFVDAENIPATVTNSSYTINTSYKSTMPFSVGNAYNIKFKVIQAGNPTYYWYNNGTVAKEYPSGTNPTVYKKADQWIVEGSWLDGFSFRSVLDDRYVTAKSSSSHNQQTDLTASKTELSKYMLKHKNDGDYFQIKNGTSYLAHTSATYLNVTTWNVENYVGNMVQFVPAETLPEFQARIDAISASILSNAIGYPKQETEKAIALVQYRTGGSTELTESNAAVASTSLNNLYNESDVNLPEDGKAYTFTAVYQDGKKYYLNYASTGVTPVKRGDSPLPASAQFVARKLDNGKFIFVSQDGKYLAWKGSNAGTNSNKGYTESWNETENSLTLQRIALNGNDTNNVTIEEFFGKLGIVGWRANNGTKAAANVYLLVDANNVNSPAFNQDASVYSRYTTRYSVAFQIEEAAFPYTTKNLNDGGDGKYYATVALPYAMVIPEGVKAYAAAAEGDVLNLTDATESSQNVPAGAYILVSESATPAAVLPAAATPAAVTNELQGSITTAPAGDIYVLNKDEDGVGFFKFNGDYNSLLGKAYLPSSAKANKLAFKFEDVVSAISAIEGNDKNVEIFDLQGRRLNKAQKGMNIINGHKVLVK